MPRPKQPRNVSRARQLRAGMSLPEVLLWRRLRGLPGGVKLRRQHPIGPYVLDFFCADLRIAFEIDGLAHDMGNRPDRDTERDGWLREAGIEVVRIPALDVLRSVDDVAEAIVRYLQPVNTPPSRLRRATSPFALRENGEDLRGGKIPQAQSD